MEDSGERPNGDPPLPSLWHDREWLKFWGGQTASLLGSQFTILALPITAVVVLRANALQMGLLNAVQYAPGLLFGLAAGVILDRTQRRRVIVGSQLLSAAALLSIPLADWLHVLSMTQLLLVGFVSGAGAALASIARSSFIPALVGRRHLLEASAKYQTGSTAASLIGPGLAGLAIQALTAPVVIAFDAVSFVIGAATAAWLRVREPPASHRRLRDEVHEAFVGMSVVWRQPLLRAITLTVAIANFGGMLSSAVFVLLFIGRIGLSATQLGVAGMVVSFSSLLAAQVTRPIVTAGGLGKVMVAAVCAIGFGNAVIAAAGFAARPWVFPLLLAGSAISGFALMNFNVPQQAIRQAVTPDHQLGRVSAVVFLAVSSAHVVGSLAGGALGTVVGLRLTLVMAAVCAVLCIAPVACSPLRALAQVPVGEVA